MTSHETADAAPTRRDVWYEVSHPLWCAPGWCEVHRMSDDGPITGEHYGGSHRQGTLYGHELIVQLCRDHLDDDDPAATKVVLRLPLNPDSMPEGTPEKDLVRLGEHVVLEPEEARLLMRRLLKTVKECEAQHRE